MPGFDGPIEIPLGLQGNAEILVGRLVVGLESNGLAEFGRCGGEIMLDITEDRAEVVVDFVVVGLEPDRLAVFGDRRVDVSP